MAKSLLDKHLDGNHQRSEPDSEPIYGDHDRVTDPIVEGILARHGENQPTHRQDESLVPEGGEVFFEVPHTEKSYHPTSSGDARAGGPFWEHMRRLFPDLDGEPGTYCIACLGTELTSAGNFRVVCVKCGRFVRWKSA